MQEDILKYLGRCIREARIAYSLTQEELAEQSGVSVRHIANIEKGRLNPLYEIIKLLIKRLGVSVETFFYPDIPKQDAELNEFIGKYHACSNEDRKILLRTLNCLSDELLSRSVIQSEKNRKTE